MPCGDAVLPGDAAEIIGGGGASWRRRGRKGGGEARKVRRGQGLGRAAFGMGRRQEGGKSVPEAFSGERWEESLFLAFEPVVEEVGGVVALGEGGSSFEDVGEALDELRVGQKRGKIGERGLLLKEGSQATDDGLSIPQRHLRFLHPARRERRRELGASDTLFVRKNQEMGGRVFCGGEVSGGKTCVGGLTRREVWFICLDGALPALA